jgi:alanine racemase
MSRPVEAIVDLQALRHNLSVAKRHAGGAKVLAVVKADAYGHGLDRVMPGLVDADGLAVVEFDAAVRIRANGISKPVLMLEGFFDERELQRFPELNLATVVHEATQVDTLVSAKLSHPVDVFVKINTGMNRLGFVPDEVPRVCDVLRQCPNVREIVAMTHFADADGARGIGWQMRTLAQATGSLGLTMCAANSAALLRFPESVGAWVRPGIMLYGASPFSDSSAQDQNLRPVMTFRSQIIGVQNLATGDCVGYACTFEAEKPMRIGIVAAGYGDGYPRHAPNGTPILVDGNRVKTVGRVSMDTLCVDISGLPEAGVGTPVTLWGHGMPVEEVATSAGTVSYELLTRITNRVPVTVTDGSANR